MRVYHDDGTETRRSKLKKMVKSLAKAQHSKEGWHVVTFCSFQYSSHHCDYLYSQGIGKGTVCGNYAEVFHIHS